MMATPRVEAFSLTHAQILDGATTFVDSALAVAGPDLDVYGVNDGSVSPQSDDWDNEGDDDVLSTWSWLRYADVNVQAGYLSFPLIAKMTGQTVASSGSGPAQTFSVDLWHEDSINVQPFPFLMVCPSKDEDGVARRLLIGLYKVQFKPITFDGPKYKDGLKINYTGRALKSAKDETGAVFPDGKKKVGRLISIL